MESVLLVSTRLCVVDVQMVQCCFIHHRELVLVSILACLTKK